MPIPIPSQMTAPGGARAVRGQARGSGWLLRYAPWLAVLLFVLAISAALGYLHTEAVTQERQTLQRDLEYSQQRLRLQLLTRQESLLQLARTLAEAHGSPAVSFAATTDALLASDADVLALSWIGSDHLVRASAAAATMPAAQQRQAGQPLSPSDMRASVDLALELMQPVIALHMPPASAASEAGASLPKPRAVLQMHVPLPALPNQHHAPGVLLAELSLDRLLNDTVPPELQARYAITLEDAHGQLLAGQAPPKRASRLPWRGVPQGHALPVPPVGNGLLLRAQAWKPARGLAGNALFWLVAALSALSIWMLAANVRVLRQRMQAQDALQDETSFRQAMEDSMATGMRALDLSGRIIYVNPAFSSMTGWSAEELIGCSAPFPYWPEDAHQQMYERLREEITGQVGPAGLALSIKRKDGSLFDARLYITPLINHAGEHTGWMGAMTDITEPNRVRAQLTAAQDRFTTVLEAFDASVSVAPLGGTELLFANRAYRQWFGSDTQGHLSLLERGGTLIHPSDDAAANGLPGLPSSVLTQGKQTEVYVAPLKLWLDVRSRYLTWVDGRLAQMVIATDITARHEAQALAAAQAERAQNTSRLITMGEMASSVAHELNQPLTAIANYCSGMRNRLLEGQISQDELLQALEKTSRQAQRAGQVIAHIRSFVKRSEPQRKMASVQRIVDEAVELAGIELKRRRVRLTHQVAPDLPELWVDPILVEQVLINLLKNGADAIDSAARAEPDRWVDLQVEAGSADGQAFVQFTVADSGPGIPLEQRDRLFEPFFSTKSEGLGIGLNLCRSIVEAHQGRIEARNLYNGPEAVGCRFSFWIPVRRAPASVAAEALAEPPGGIR